MSTTVVARDRWTARPVLGAALRLTALLGPVVAGVAVAVVLAALLPEATTTAAQVLWWAAVLGGSAAGLWGSDRVARRLLPLAVLLELSLVFPDRAPSRLRAARTSSVRDMDSRLARLRGQGAPMEPYEAAETLVVLVGILGLHDKRTRGHAERVRAFTDLLSEELGLDEDSRMRLRWAALVHDLGKLTVPASVLNGGTDLRDEDWAALRAHPAEGVRLVAGLLPWLQEWGGAVGEHHERWDGTGYPHGLAGEQISYAARLISVCDSFEVITSSRSYQAARSAAAGRAELIRCAGTQFDPAVVRAFVGISLGRLRWVLGPVTWLAELPFVVTADKAGQAVKVASVTAMTAGLLAVGALPGSGERLPVDGVPAVAAGEPVLVPAGGTSALPASPRPVVTTSAAAAVASPTPVRTAAALPPRRAPGAGTLAGGRTSPLPQRLPRTAASPQPTAAPSPRVLETATRYLTPTGLAVAPPRTRSTRVVRPAGTTAFDSAPLAAPLVLDEDLDLVAFLLFRDDSGNPLVEATLSACGRGGCEVLARGYAVGGARTEDGPLRYETRLSRTWQEREVPAGRTLRLQLVRPPGSKGDALLGLGGPAATASRLVLR